MKKILDENVNKILYGGDYNPEQWSSEVWEQDMKLLPEASIDIVTLNVFNWAMLQPNEETYDFNALDETVKRVTEKRMHICMATSTGAHPAWMAYKYPDILRTEFNGMKRKFGGRHNSCPNSPTFQFYGRALATQLATHYKDQENIVAWHVGNEYGGACYCENCEKAFRVWLRRKYSTLPNLNQAWNTSFWGHTFYQWEEIVAPNLLSEHFEEKRSMYQGITLDYMRFNSDSMLENYKAERDAIKKQIPTARITTNFMGAYKPIDYKKWSKEMDFVSWDNYPPKNADPASVAFEHDLMRGLKGGMPFALMEQTPSVSNWLADNGLKRPGVLRLLSYQAVAHGADTVMYFQMRRSPASCEKFHGAVIDHVGHGETRVFRECAALGKELLALGNRTLGTQIQSDIAILFDWENWWAIEASAGPSTRLHYLEEVLSYYRALHQMHILVDIIGPEDEFAKYRLVIAPIMYMVKAGTDQRMEAYAEQGGNLLFTYFSGYVNENDRITLGGYPGKLRKLTGIWVEESDILSQRQENHFVYQKMRYPAKLMCDILHLETAYSTAEYEEDFYQGAPVLTENIFGKGMVFYVGTSSNPQFYKTYLQDICTRLKISKTEGVYSNQEMGQEGVEIERKEIKRKEIERLEIVKRVGNEKEYLFCLNHGESPIRIRLSKSAKELISQKEYQREDCVMMESLGVCIFEQEKENVGSYNRG